MSARRKRGFEMLLAASILLAAIAPAWAEELFDEATLRFADELDLHRWERLAVRHGGRVKTFDSFARSQLGFFHGRTGIDGASPTFSFLELYLNTGAYLQKPVIHVPERPLRERLVFLIRPEVGYSLRETHRLDPVDLLPLGNVEFLVATGRAEQKQVHPERIASLAVALYGLGGELKLRSALRALLNRVDGFLAAGSVRVVPLGDGSDQFLELPLPPNARELGVSEKDFADLQRRFAAVVQAWRARDAQQCDELLNELCDVLARRGGQAYPPPWRQELEILHDRTLGFSAVWIGYAAAMVLLLAAYAKRDSKRLRPAGAAVFALATAFLAGGFALRWFLSGRGWQLPPLTNQHETVMGAALAGALAAAVLEAVFKKGIFALAASYFATVALLAAFFQPLALGAGITAPPAILLTPILGWHVATLVLAYAMAGMSLLVSLAYVGLSIFSARPRQALADLDRANVILLQLACWLLAIGVALGAYWGDRAWGRWWGWDPKETWGLMTFLVYLAVVHLRLVVPARRRGLWTAAMAIFGCTVMGFAWWGVNYLLVGLHSYA